MIDSVAYMRCSGASQISGDTWERQIESIQSCCESKGLQITHEYREEAIPGKLGEEDRPAFQEMVADLLANGCRIIVIESMDRFARQYDIQQRLAEYLASKGLTLISANTGEDITAALMGDPMRRALVQMQGVFAELDKNMLVAKLKKARERIRNTGLKCDGRKSYGEKPGEEEILQRMRNLRDMIPPVRYQELADIMNSSGVPTRMGKKWKASTIQKILTRTKENGSHNVAPTPRRIETD